MGAGATTAGTGSGDAGGGLLKLAAPNRLPDTLAYRDDGDDGTTGSGMEPAGAGGAGSYPAVAGKVLADAGAAVGGTACVGNGWTGATGAVAGTAADGSERLA